MQFIMIDGGGSAALEFLGFFAHTNEGQTVTFDDVDIGAAVADRYVFVSVPYYHGTSSHFLISSATIGGVAATIFHAPTNSGGIGVGIGCAIIAALVPAGTTADVVLNFEAGSGFYRPDIGVYRVTGLLSLTPVDMITFGTAGSDIPHTFTTNVSEGGVALFACAVNGNSVARTMSDMVADFSSSPIAGLQYLGSGAETPSSGTQDCTITGGTTANWSAVMVSFR